MMGMECPPPTQPPTHVNINIKQECRDRARIQVATGGVVVVVVVVVVGGGGSTHRVGNC